ncbi:MAG: metal-dependent transcriptional regulator [Myxococcales bacterium]|jgi:DtxR family Mn-dependent transcriptional regulator|nr:metal-dependent transcriptional regulator [Myxococcales bacterium]
MNASPTNSPALSSEKTLSTSLEDYLETIYELTQKKGGVRVKDIARARSVKAASVSMALRKLADMDLVRYERRGAIALTEAGLKQGRKIFARHDLLCRFFTEVLQLPPAEAEAQACAMEHGLTDSGMNQIVRLFEFLDTCPEFGHVIARFHACPRRHDESPQAESSIGVAEVDHCATCRPQQPTVQTRTLTQLKPGETARVANVVSHGAIRQRMLDMGLLPNALVELERFGPGGDPVWIKCLGAQIALRRTEAEAVLIAAETA